MHDQAVQQAGRPPDRTARRTSRPQCVLARFFSPADNAKYAHFSGKPTISEFESTDLYRAIGEQVELACNAEGSPKPTVQWLLVCVYQIVYDRSGLFSGAWDRFRSNSAHRLARPKVGDRMRRACCRMRLMSSARKKCDASHAGRENLSPFGLRPSGS